MSVHGCVSLPCPICFEDPKKEKWSNKVVFGFGDSDFKLLAVENELERQQAHYNHVVGQLTAEEGARWALETRVINLEIEIQSLSEKLKASEEKEG